MTCVLASLTNYQAIKDDLSLKRTESDKDTPVGLDDCLRLFSQKETLMGEERWYCYFLILFIRS